MSLLSRAVCDLRASKESVPDATPPAWTNLFAVEWNSQCREEMMTHAGPGAPQCIIGDISCFWHASLQPWVRKVLRDKASFNKAIHHHSSTLRAVVTITSDATTIPG